MTKKQQGRFCFYKVTFLYSHIISIKGGERWERSEWGGKISRKRQKRGEGEQKGKEKIRKKERKKQ